MDAKEVVEKSKALQRATAAGESPATILTILGELKTGVVPSEDLLRSTKIGVVVNRSKQHKNPEVARLANEIVKKWRDEIQKQKGSPSSGTSKKLGVNSPTSNDSSTPEKPTFTVPPEQRDYKQDKVDIKRTSQPTRDSCIGLIYNGLCFLSTSAPASIITCAVAVENAAFEALGPETNDAYKSKIRSLFQNLKNKSNSALRQGVLSGEISPDRFVRMTHEELKSAERRAEDEKLANENMREAMVPQAERSVSSSLQCGKCHQRKVSYSQAQTRSADEPMTTFCECTVCGKRWKVSDGWGYISLPFCNLTSSIRDIVFLNSTTSELELPSPAYPPYHINLTIGMLPCNLPYQNNTLPPTSKIYFLACKLRPDSTH